MALPLRHLTAATALLLALAAPGLAQPAATPRAQIEFTVFSSHRHQHLQFLPAPDAAPVTLEFFGNTRSPLYACTLPETNHQLTFHRSDAPAIPVAIADIPPDVTRALLLFVAIPDAPPKSPALRVQIVDDSPGALPAGHATVINASGREYLARIGRHTLPVPLGTAGKVPVRGTVQLRLATRNGDDWTPAGRHTFRLDDRSRASLVFFPPASPTGIAPVIRTLIDEPPAADPSPADTTSP